jgi:nucleoside 2-deoxyribosyltransferase
MCFYELGYAHALNKPVILLTRDRDSVPFDLQGVNNLEYKHASDLVDTLPARIKAVLNL